MYAAVATAFSSTPATTRATRRAIPSTCGRTARDASTASPITSTLLTVPTPGRCRSGIHSSSTSAPTTIETVPSEPPMLRATPWCRTSHGITPSRARTSSAIENPYSTRPA